MANYRDWNRALACYYSSGIPLGTTVYLSLDDDLLEFLAGEFRLAAMADNWGDDFRAAVKEEVILDGRIKLDCLLGRDSEGYPLGAAFLGATVLAAYQMADEDKISKINYFSRLREVLGFSGSGRPPGMSSGAEEPLWQDWNSWLREWGFQPSASRGLGGVTTYINYPISQSLLRRWDRDRLRLLFETKQWQAQWDSMGLFARVRREAAGLSQHLKYLLEDPQRYEAIAEAIHEVYQQWQAEGIASQAGRRTSGRSWSRNLWAGLYREEELFEDVAYYLYPKQARGREPELVEIEYRDNTYTLRPERPGWYFPIEEALTFEDLERGASCAIASPSDLEQLILPPRDFWILVPEPNIPNSGIYASWGRPSLDESFILLCREKLLSDLDSLRQQGLLEWTGEPLPIFEDSDWLEFEDCQIVSLAFNRANIENLELKEALQPSIQLSIVFSEGLRCRNLGAWLKGYSPEIKVCSSSATKVRLKVTEVSDGREVWDNVEPTNTRIAVNLSTPGEYLVEAMTDAGESRERSLSIIDWNQLLIAEPQERPWISFNNAGARICGSVIQLE